MRKRLITQYFIVAALLSLITKSSLAQLPYPAMVGYWENWMGSRFVPLKDIDPRYNVIQIAFAEAKDEDVDYELIFRPPSHYTEASFKEEVKFLQDQGKKVLISIGGQNDIILLDSVAEKETFVASMNAIVDKWGFDGIDIDLEGNSLNFLDINIESPGDIKQKLMIEAIHEIMQNHRTTHGEKLLLTMAPETFYVHGGLSGASLGYKRGAYLPIIEEFRDSIDMLNVQLYNSGSMFGLDGKIYSQGTADWMVAMTESVIRGFKANGSIGTYSGLPANKVGVALPGCHSYDAVPHDDVKKAMDYLLGVGPQPGSYKLIKEGGYPDLMGMMTWSINSDRRCGPSYGFVKTFEKVFTDSSYIEMENSGEILEGEEDGGVIKVNLFNDTFVNPLEVSSWTVGNLPAGVSMDTVVRLNDSTAQITLKGSSSDLYMRDITNVRVTLQSDQLERKTTGSINDRAGLVLTKKPQPIPGVVEPEGYFDRKDAWAAKNWDDDGTYYVRLDKSAWVDLKVDVAETREYLMTIKLATISGEVHYMEIKSNGKSVLTTGIISETFFRKWDEFSFKINLTEGEQTLRLNCTKGWMDIENVTFEVETSSNEVSNSSLSLYPNPASNSFVINSESAGELLLYNLNGTLVKQQMISSGSNNIQITDLASGLYMVKYISEDGLEQFDKLIKK